MTKYEIMFYNALLVVLPTLMWNMWMGDISEVLVSPPHLLTHAYTPSGGPLQWLV